MFVSAVMDVSINFQKKPYNKKVGSYEFLNLQTENH